MTLIDKLSKKEQVLFIVIAGFFITLYFRSMPAVNNIFIGMLALCSFFFNSCKEKKNLLRRRPEIILMVAFYMLQIISTFFSENTKEGLHVLQIRIPLLVFPLSLGLICIREELKDLILLIYSIITTMASIVCLVYAFRMYMQHNDTGFLYNDSLSVAIGKQSIYMAMMLNIAIFSYVYLLWKKSPVIHNKWMIYFGILFLLVIHFLLASRIAISILYSGFIAFAAYYLFTTRKKSILPAMSLIAGLLVVILLLVAVFPKTLNRFKELKYTGYSYNSHGAESHYNMELTPDQWNGTNERLAIWKCGWEIAKKHFFWGVQLGDKHDALINMYRVKHFDFAVKTGKNMHSTYLDVLTSMGIFGLIIFMTGFLVMPLISCFRQADITGIFIILAFAFSLITETYIDRSLGCVLLSFFICLIISNKRDTALPGY